MESGAPLSFTEAFDAFISDRSRPLFADVSLFDSRTQSLDSAFEEHFRFLRDDSRILASVFLLSSRSIALQSVLGEFHSIKKSELEFIFSRIDSLSSTLSMIDSEIASGSSALSEMRSAIGSIELETEQLGSELKVLHESGVEASDAFASLQNEWDSLAEEMERLSGEISGDKDELRNEILRQSSLRMSQGSLETVLRALSDDFESVSGEIARFENEKAIRMAVMKAHALRESELFTEVDNVADRIRSMEADIVGAKVELEDLRHRNAEQGRARAETQIMVANYRETVEELELELTEVRARVDGLSVVRHRLESDADAISEGIAAMDAEIAKAQEEADAISAELLEKNQRLSELQKSPVERRAKIRPRNTTLASQTPRMPSRLFPEFSIAQSSLE
jgi:chromosome segregation ATPase